MTKRAAIYLRISLDRLGDEAAVERQLEDCLAIIEARGWEQAGEPYVDNSVSASKRDVKRPEYDRMVNDYQRGVFDALVCYDLDRLTRQPRQLEDWIDAAEERGLVIVTANGEADLSTDGGRMFARVKAAVARSEIERKGARQRRANEQRVAQGRPVPTRRRFGYESDGITPREPEASVARRIFEDFVGGASIRSIAGHLYRDGVDPAPGREWSTKRLRLMLKNPAYGGLLATKNGPVASDSIVPIVAPETAAEARAILADEARQANTRGPGRRYLASGLVHCGGDGCDRTLLARAGYYVCKTTQIGRQYLDQGDSRHVGISIPMLDGYLREQMAVAILTTPREALGEVDAPALAPLVERIERLDKATHSIVADRDEGLVSPAVARARLLELKGEREAVEADMDHARAARSSAASLADLASELLPDAEAMPMADFWKAQGVVADRIKGLDLDRQRAALGQLLDVTVSRGRGLSRVHVWHLVADHLNPAPEND